MQEFNVISLLQKYSGEIVLSACLGCALAVLIKKCKNVSDKFFIVLSLFFGLCAYLVIGLFFLKERAVLLCANALTSGGISATISLFVKRTAMLSGNDLKKSLEKLLSSIVLSDELDKVVDDILQKLASYEGETREDLKNVLKENVNADLSDVDLENIVNFILKACGIENTKKDGK